MYGMISQLLRHLTFFLLHVDSTAAFPPAFTREEEEACIAKMAAGDDTARQALIAHNLRLVAHMTKKFYSPEREQEELISVGTLGLMKAAASFQPEKGARFATYASRCIENEILMHYRARKKTAGETFLDDPLEYDKDGNPLTLLDIMPDSADLEEQVAQTIQQQQLYEYIETRLTERERTVLIHRYGLYGNAELTQREVAALLGISRSYVSRIEKHALKVLHAAYTE